MSNPLAMAAVTATLSRLLEAIKNEPNLHDTTISTNPPDTVQTEGAPAVNQINLFLYQTTINAAWRNHDLPSQVRPGEIGAPPLALNLHYLLTAYGRDNNDLLAHRLMGHAAGILHDYTVLQPSDIRDALAGNDLGLQVERVRLTMLPLSTDDLFKLWSGFQTHYRFSLAYEASVVLIESRRAPRTPLPVVARGERDQGVQTQPNSGLPTLDEVQLPERQNSVRVGEEVVLVGHNLSPCAALRFYPAQRENAVEVAPEPDATSTAVRVKVPNLAAGFYTVAVLVRQDATHNWSSIDLPVALAPLITPPLSVAIGDTLTMQVVPEVGRDQRALLLIGNQVIARVVEPDAPATSPTLDFSIPAELPPGSYLLRLRVDGVDSLLNVDTNPSSPTFRRFTGPKVAIT